MSFINDPFSIIDDVAKELNPDVNYISFLDPSIKFKKFLFVRHGACGYTLFPSDGDVPEIHISTNIPFEAMPETYAHEVAHVLTPEDKDHGEQWNDTFAEMQKRYNAKIEERLQ